MRREAKKEVAKAKSKAYDELYEGLDTKEGEQTLHRLARQRHQAGKDVQQVRMMKDKDGNVMTDKESVLRIWKEYYMGLVNEENEREIRENDGERVNLEVESVSKEEVRENMQRMKNGKAVGPDDIPVEVWKCIGESALKFLTKLYNRTSDVHDRNIATALKHIKDSGLPLREMCISSEIVHISRSCDWC